ncbi:TRAP transporter small permease [Zeimonas arvi]|uniref:TRAP transporter small permease protein n=1 Tax=Zeimonas arvi TaxID=2498847 RepID=A0A5C8NWG2_9BURK|nr:TRAP transporter small permease [Zeimonas arvi]TXL65330.1 TRAP transporter small permease [Zeimonas arvi]
MALLHKLYRLSGYLSAVSLVLICVLILAQILARSFGTMVPDSDEFAAWAMAASGFFGLPYALHAGAHIRVTAALRFLPEHLRHATEVLASAIALAVAAYLAWYCAAFVLESYTFKEVSPGLLALPMWVPQLSMVFGSALLALAFAERLVCVLRRQGFETGEGASGE